MGVEQLFSGVQMIHKNNHVHTSREGYMLKEDIDEIKEVQYNGEGTILTNLSQGMYKININGTMYVFLLHDALVGSDRVIINNEDDYKLYVALKRRPFYIYKVNEATEIARYGYEMLHTVNDKLDLFVMDGYTRFKENKLMWDLDHPRKIEFTSTYNIQITDSKGKYTDYIFNTKSYLKSISVDNIKAHDICDRIYVEGALNRALILFKLGRIVFSGYEPFEKVNEYSDNFVSVYRYANKMVKPNSHLRCTHLPAVSWEEMIDISYQENCICAGIDESTQGFYIKVKKSEYPDWESLKNKFLYWYLAREETIKPLRVEEYEEFKEKTNHGITLIDYLNINPPIATPVSVEYELTNQEWRQIAIENYKIPTYFNTTYMIISPYEVNHATREILKDIVGVVPKDGIIKSKAQHEIESGNTEMYYKILEENNILRNLITMHEYTGRYKTDLDSNIVGVVPYSGVIANTPGLELDSGKPERYAKILQENKILRNLFSLKNEDKKPVFTIDSPYFVAVVPKNGIVQSSVVHERQSGYPEYYSQIIDENYIWRNLVVTGEHNIKAMYFYKHLRISTDRR